MASGKGLYPKRSFDYEETFSPVAMIKSIRILLAIAHHMDYEIWQMDVKTTFLNRSLDETIYMVQPEVFIEKGQERKCANSKNPFMGLNRYQGLGISSLTNLSSYLNLSNVLINLVCTRDAAETWWWFLLIHEEDIPLLGNNNGKIVSNK